MPTIGTMAYGFDASGVDTYLNNLYNNSVKPAIDAIKDISSIKTVCDNEWEGQAKTNFLTNLSTDAEHVSAQIEAAYKILQSEMNALAAAMSAKDKELIASGDTE